MDAGWLSAVIWIFGVWSAVGTATALLLASMIRRADQAEFGGPELSLVTANGMLAAEAPSPRA